MKPEKIKLYKAAIDQWGQTFEYMKVVEECGEFLQAYSKVMENKWSKERLAEELADVEIMLEQIKISHNISAQVKNIKVEKIERLKQRLEN